MLAKDGSLLALFRTVGTCDSDQGLSKPGVLSDRASTEMDPMTALRTDVLYVFLQKKLSHVQRKDELDLAAVHEHPKLLRQATIVRTVGGSAHGYIHCSLSRLALGPEHTQKPLDLKHLHRICRPARDCKGLQGIARDCTICSRSFPVVPELVPVPVCLGRDSLNLSRNRRHSMILFVRPNYCARLCMLW